MWSHAVEVVYWDRYGMSTGYGRRRPCSSAVARSLGVTRAAPWASPYYVSIEGRPSGHAGKDKPAYLSPLGRLLLKL